MEGHAYQGRILIADDEELFLRATARLLEKEGFYCHASKTGQEVITELESADYDLLITDINMPGNKGLELLHTRSAGQNIPIIVVTG